MEHTQTGTMILATYENGKIIPAQWIPNEEEGGEKNNVDRAER